MREHRCEACNRGRLHRSERRGLLEHLLYPLLGRFPWRCSYCRNRVLLQDRGEGRFYVTPGARKRSRDADRRRDSDAA